MKNSAKGMGFVGLKRYVGQQSPQAQTDDATIRNWSAGVKIEISGARLQLSRLPHASLKEKVVRLITLFISLHYEHKMR